MIPNDDNYLLLKQLLVVSELHRLNAEVQLTESDMGRDAVEKIIKRLLVDIENNFTVPYVMLENNAVGIDMRSFIKPLVDTILPLNDDHDCWGYITTSNTPSGIENCVYKYPIVKEYIAELKENIVNKGELFGSSRGVAAELITAVDNAFRSIQYWVENPDKKTLGQMLILTNIIIIVDTLFSCINDYHGTQNDGN